MNIHIQRAMAINSADEYKRRAAECMREAECVSDDMLRQAYFQLARNWKKMADNAASAKAH